MAEENSVELQTGQKTNFSIKKIQLTLLNLSKIFNCSTWNKIEKKQKSKKIHNRKKKLQQRLLGYLKAIFKRSKSYEYIAIQIKGNS